MSSDLNKKVAIVTGATSGIGEVTAVTLAARGMQVLVLSRDPNKTRLLTERIHQSGGDALAFNADLSSIQEIRRVAEEIRQRVERVDVLVNNAGALFMSHHLSSDGLEMSFALNHLNYFLLTRELMGLIQKSTQARIVNVSSAAHLSGHIDFNDLQSENSFSGWRAYCDTKLMNVLFTYELARRLDGTGITANVLHPGFVATNFGKSNGGIYVPVFDVAHIGAISPEEGAKTMLHLASSPVVEGVSGKYFVQSKEARSSRESYDLTIAAHLWEASERLTS